MRVRDADRVINIACAGRRIYYTKRTNVPSRHNEPSELKAVGALAIHTGQSDKPRPSVIHTTAVPRAVSLIACINNPTLIDYLAISPCNNKPWRATSPFTPDLAVLLYLSRCRQSCMSDHIIVLYNSIFYAYVKRVIRVITY